MADCQQIGITEQIGRRFVFLQAIRNWNESFWRNLHEEVWFAEQQKGAYARWLRKNPQILAEWLREILLNTRNSMIGTFVGI